MKESIIGITKLITIFEYVLLVIGYAQNSYVGINKNKGSSTALMKLPIPNILITNEPNKIHIRIDQGNKEYFSI